MSGIPILGSFFGGGSTEDDATKDKDTKKEEAIKDEKVVVLDQTVNTKVDKNAAEDTKLEATENSAAVAAVAGSGTSLGPTLMGLPVLPIIFTLSMIGLVFDTDLIPLPDSLNPQLITSGR